MSNNTFVAIVLSVMMMCITTCSVSGDYLKSHQQKRICIYP